MKRTMLVLVLMLLVSLPLSGCSVAMVLGEPPHVDLEQVEVGQNRMDVESLLVNHGIGKTREVPPNDTLVHYDFRSGTPGETRFRVVPYIAADFFTLCITELIFWPIESGVQNTFDHTAWIQYNAEENVVGFRFHNHEGKVEHAGGNITGQTSLAPN